MLIPRFYLVDVKNDHDQRGRLNAPSWPFAVQAYETVQGALSLVETTQISTRTEAGEKAEDWARRKRGNLALAYSRRTGVVLAQYCQGQDGTLGFLLYTPHGRLDKYLNTHLFEPLPGSAPQESGESAQPAMPFAETAPTCTYPVLDDSRQGREWWVAQRPSNSGLWLSVYPDRPVNKAGGEEPVLTAVLEVYGDQLRILWWDRENLEGDPHVLVIESNLSAIDLKRLVLLQQQANGNA